MKQITIEDLIPFLKNGWVAYSKDYWCWFDKKPRYDECVGVWYCRTSVSLNSCFKIKAPKCDWKDSLIRVKNRHKGLEPHTYYVPTTPMHILHFPEKLEKIDLQKAFGIAEPKVIREDFENWKKRRKNEY